MALSIHGINHYDRLCIIDYLAFWTNHLNDFLFLHGLVSGSANMQNSGRKEMRTAGPEFEGRRRKTCETEGCGESRCGTQRDGLGPRLSSLFDQSSW